MAQLKLFRDLKAKEKFFSDTNYYQIDTKRQFDKWFDVYTNEAKSEKKTDFIFRGMGDASYKLYTSAQRLWIQNDMKEWAPKNYLDFVNDLVQRAKTYPLLKRVFDIYQYSDSEREFPILSIMQHYWGPTPLMDWTYNINVALFFAIEKISSGCGIGRIDNYFSIYRINKAKYRDELLSLRDISNSSDIPSISDFNDWGDDDNSNSNRILYLSDLDQGNVHGKVGTQEVKIVDGKQLTSIYNQNIIPQEGLFIFNPFSEKTIEEIFNVNLEEEGWNLELVPFACFNIKKDLADYIRRRIKEKFSIDKSFIYPHLYDDMNNITNMILNSYAKK